MWKWILPLTVLSLTACESKDDDQIYSAQTCLDTATEDTVDTCVAKISGISSQRSYVIRCSADFIRGGITTQTIIDAVENIDKNGSASVTDPNVEFFNKFSFADSTKADQAVVNCTASGSNNLIVLAQSAKTATTLKALAGGDLATWISGLNAGSITALATSNPDELAAIGSSIITMQPIACGTGGQFEGTEICDNLTNAIAGGASNEEIAQAYLSQLQNSNN